MERKLASIRRIAEIREIPGADAIECAVVDGWTVVTKKGEFKPGDMCVYFEIDSVLPITDEFEFLRKSCYVKRDWLPKGEGFRLKTIKLRKQLSQGLVVPMSVGESFVGNPLRQLHEGDDLTNFIGVVKWDPPVPAQLAGQAKGNFPSFIPKTDQERIQNLVREVTSNHEWRYEVTTKLDGSSMTIYLYEGKTGVCSRNLELQWEQEGNTFVDVAKDLPCWAGMDEIGDIAIQGELMGPGIQGNRENLPRHEFFVYDIYDIRHGRYMPPFERQLITKRLGLQHVPVKYMNHPAPNSIDKILEMSDTKSITNPVAEGLVWKRMDGTFSFKAISNKFLMQEE